LEDRELKINGYSSEVLKLLGKDLPSNRTNSKKQSSSEAIKEEKGVVVDLSGNLNVEVESVPTEKVEKIKKAIKEGKYTVNLHKISDAILKDILGE